MKKILGGFLVSLFMASLITGCGSTQKASNDSAQNAEASKSEQAKSEGDSYPAKSINILVPFAAGGAADLMTRSLEPFLKDNLGQSIIIENKPGGSGAISMNAVMKSKADGYTMGITSSGPAVITPILNEVGYTNQDYATVSQILYIPLVLAVPNDSPYKTAKEFFDAAKANPNTIKVGTPGATVSQHITMQQIEKDFGIEFNLVPFDGGAESVNALLGGNLDAIFNVESEVVPHIKSGKFKALAISAADRSKFLPDVATFKEQGMDIVNGALYGLMAPKDTPQDVIDKVDGTIKEALQDPGVKESLQKIYLDPVYSNSKDFRALIDKTYESYSELLKK